MKIIVIAAFMLAAGPVGALSQRDTFNISTCALEAKIIGPAETLDCFTIDEDGDTYALIEVHGGRCKGDPNTAPTRAYFSSRNGKLGFEYWGDEWKACP